MIAKYLAKLSVAYTARNHAQLGTVGPCGVYEETAKHIYVKIMAAVTPHRLSSDLNQQEHIGSIRIQCQCHDPKQRSTPTFSLWPRDSEMTFLFVPDPRNFFHLSETVIFKLYIMSSIELIFFLGSGTKRKVISESLGHDENVGVLRCFGS